MTLDVGFVQQGDVLWSVPTSYRYAPHWFYTHCGDDLQYCDDTYIHVFVIFCLFICLFIYLFIYLFIFVYLCLFVLCFVVLYFYFSLCVSFCWFACLIVLFVYLFLCLFVCLFVHLCLFVFYFALCSFFMFSYTPLHSNHFHSLHSTLTTHAYFTGLFGPAYMHLSPGMEPHSSVEFHNCPPIFMFANMPTPMVYVRGQI